MADTHNSKQILKKERFGGWLKKHSGGPHAKLLLAVVAFSEASVFLVPPDVVLIAILVAGTGRWVYYSTLTTLFSVLGGILGYFIGIWLFDIFGQPLIEFYRLQEEFVAVSLLFKNNAFLAVFVSAFTPIPYKIFTIAAGLFKVNFFLFLLASILGRGLRFFIEGYVVHLFGETIFKGFMKYFDLITLFLVVLIALLVIF